MTIVDLDGTVLISSDASLPDRKAPARPPLSQLVNAGFLRQLRVMYGPPHAYEVSYPFKLGPPGQQGALRRDSRRGADRPAAPARSRRRCVPQDCWRSARVLASVLAGGAGQQHRRWPRSNASPRNWTASRRANSTRSRSSAATNSARSARRSARSDCNCAACARSSARCARTSTRFSAAWTTDCSCSRAMAARSWSVPRSRIFWAFPRTSFWDARPARFFRRPPAAIRAGHCRVTSSSRSRPPKWICPARRPGCRRGASASACR